MDTNSIIKLTLINTYILNYAFVFILFLDLSTSHPFVLTKPPKMCSFNSNTTFSSELLQAETENIVLYYTLCGYVPPNKNCGVNVTACLKNKTDNSTNVMGRKFILGVDQNLYLDGLSNTACKAIPKKKYNLTIKFVKYAKDQHLEVKNECDYIITLVPNFKPPCTTRIRGLLMDLGPLGDLNKIFGVVSDNRSFSLTLCHANPKCNTNKLDGISSCQVINDTTIPLSRVDSEGLYYNDIHNELSIQGSYKGDRKYDDKKFELILKCNWYENIGKIHYKKVRQQGKQYKFEMETSYGCVKLPPQCEINDKFYTYNLKDLYNSHGFVKVSGVPNNREIYLNVCGPLELKGPKTNCTDAFSQVCEIHNGIFINKGSISSHIKISDDVIKLKFTDGASCKEDKKYSTNINFLCSGKERGPVYVDSNECETFIDWPTPQACPIYSGTNCEYIHQEYQKCLINHQGYNYDLSSLSLNNTSYEVKDNTNSGIKYILNVCGPAVDDEAPCMKDSMILMKDLHQNNLKYKVKSLGKMYSMYVANKTIVITATSGSYCGSGIDYTSNITFICSDKEEQPQLINNTQCSFQFQWKTHHACPVGGYNKCLIRDSSNKFLLDLTKLQKTLVNISLNNKRYKFNLCHNNYTECSDITPGNCTYHPVNTTLVKHDRNIFLGLNLSRNCNSDTDFNMVSIELVCDRILNNEHFKYIGVSKCFVMLKLFTNVICIEEDLPLDDNKYDIIDEYNETENCSVNNPVTGYTFYISSLDIDIPFSNCPKVIFNYQDLSVLLVYSNDTNCEEINGYGKYIDKLLLRCSKTVANHTEVTPCSRTNKFEGPEICKLFEVFVLESPSTTSNVFTPGAIIGLIAGVLLLLIGASMFFIYKFRKRIQGASSYSTIYEKDADL